MVFELPTNNQWSFDVQWCPRNPGLISSSTFDGHVTIYSLTGGGHPIQPSNKVIFAPILKEKIFLKLFVTHSHKTRAKCQIYNCELYDLIRIVKYSNFIVRYDRSVNPSSMQKLFMAILRDFKWKKMNLSTKKFLCIGSLFLQHFIYLTKWQTILF